MSKVTNTINESNFIANNYDLSKLFIRNNRYQQGTFINNTGAAAAFPAGTLLARDSSTGNLVPWDNDVVTNGQQLIVGVLRDDIPSIANAATASNVYFCIKGDVAEEGIIFNDVAQSFDTVVVLADIGTNQVTKRVRDILYDIGIIPVVKKELTSPDNS